MTDVNNTQPTQPTQQTAPTTAPPVEEPKPPTLAELLDKAPIEELVKHPRFAGVLGDRLQRERERVRQEINEENSQKAREDADRELERLANEDPVTFAQRYLSDKEQKRIKDHQAKVEEDIKSNFAKQIGQTYQNLPDWQKLTPEEFGKLQAAVAGKPDEEALVAFNLAALDVIAERRTTERLSEWRQKDLAKERDALRTEEAAKLLQSSPRPDMARGSQPSAFDPTKLSDKEFDAWYRKEYLGRT